MWSVQRYTLLNQAINHLTRGRNRLSVARNSVHELGARTDLKSIALIAILAAAIVTTGGGSPAGAGTPAPIRISGAQIRQVHGQLLLDVRTREPWRRRLLARALHRDVCVQFFRGNQQAPRRLVCAERRPQTTQLGVYALALGPKGQVLSRRLTPADVVGPNPVTMRIALLPAEAGLAAGRWGWDVVSGSDSRSCPPTSSLSAPCRDRAPNSGTATLRVRPARLVGCAAAKSSGYRRHGSGAGKRIAVTFDDGPSPFTPSIVRILAGFHARSTFFEIGRQIPGHAALLRQMLREGDELGNHTFDHADLAGDGPHAVSELRATNALIRGATRFVPCVFRPPYGAVSDALVATAHKERLATIGWDVDPQDWALPGVAAIYDRVVGALHPGAIILLHDGPANRQETVAALPSILGAIQARGYELVTVSELLGFSPIVR